MSANLVDVSVFTSPVVVPTDGDALTAASVLQAFQPLANRTRNSKDRLDAIELRPYGYYSCAGSGISTGTNAPLTQVYASGMTLASNVVTLTTAGLYVVSFFATVNLLLLTGGVANDANFDVYVAGVGALLPLSSRLYGNDAGQNQAGSGVYMAPGGAQISVISRNSSLDIVNGRLTITRIA